MSMNARSALVYDRYELKYHIPLALVDEISDYISGFCELDYYSQKSPDLYYSINNLYLDTPTQLFFRTRMSGVDERFNMRVRTYGDEENPLWFLEVKHKSKGFVRKTRAKVSDPTWFEHLSNGTTPESIPELSYGNYAADFFHRAFAYQAAPVVFTQYRRKAYFSNIDEYARVTFDRDLRCVPRSEYSFCRSGLSHYDLPSCFDPETNVILELKCEARVPYWMLDLIRRFDLQRSSFSKFAFALCDNHQDRTQFDQWLARVPAS